jgi:predicted nucleic acid-binding protein
MERPRVYIETTIPSFYCDVRQDPEVVARRNWTQHWWDFKRHAYEVVTSAAVLDELLDGTYPGCEQAVKLMDAVELVSMSSEVAEIAAEYIRRRVMPDDPGGDALHLAVASCHKCDFLLTWNCKHLANANKFLHIERVNGMLGLYVPKLVTPLELLDEDA